MRVAFPVKLSHCVFVAFCLFMLLRERLICVEKGGQQLEKDLKQLLEKQGSHVVLAKDGHFFSSDKKEAREKRETAKGVQTANEDKSKKDISPTTPTSTTTEAAKSPDETTTQFPVTELFEEKEFSKETTTKATIEANETTTTKVDSADKEDWKQVFSHRGSKKFKSCLRVTSSDVLGVSDSPLIQKNLFGSRMAAFFLLFELVLLFAEVGYFAGSGEIPRKAGDLIMSGLHTFLVATSAALLMRQRFSWAEDGVWGPGDVPSFPRQLCLTEALVWLTVAAHILETLFRRYMHATLVITKDVFAEYEMRDTYIGAYNNPIDGSFEIEME